MTKSRGHTWRNTSAAGAWGPSGGILCGPADPAIYNENSSPPTRDRTWPGCTSFSRTIRNRMALCPEMVRTILQVGAAVCGDHLCHPRELSVGRSRSTPTGGNGLRSFCGNWDGRNGDCRNGVFWREHEPWPGRLPRAHPPRAHWPQGLFGHRRMRANAENAVSRTSPGAPRAGAPPLCVVARKNHDLGRTTR